MATCDTSLLLQRLRQLLSAVCLSASLISATGYAGEVIDAYVDRMDDHYLLHLDMRIEGNWYDVYSVLVDFNYINLVNDSITDSQLLESNGTVHRVFFVSEGCVWILCRSVKQVVTVTELGGGYIMSVTDPEHSDLEYGRTLWQIIDEGSTTRIKYNADFVPDFWVPPLIGPVIFKTRMLEEGQKTVNGLEHLVAELYQ